MPNRPGRVEGKVAVVTGAASGLGAATAELYIAEGAKVLLTDIQDEAGQALAASLGSNAAYLHCDVTVEADVEAAVALAVSTFGRLDIMFNNAGVVGAVGSICDTTEAAWNRTNDILIKSVFFGMKHAGRVMVPQGSGSIISTSSTAGIMGSLGPHVYTAAKHAVIGLTRSVASEFARSGVRVNAISPGSTVSALTADVVTGDHTDMETTAKHMAAGSALGIAGMPIDIANAALYLASEESRNMTAQVIVVDGGQTTIPGGGRFHKQEAKVLLEGGRRG
jgi:NAD(P)-dependent dehydrogenase (short-subunit alcohol dehydrogenase family)